MKKLALALAAISAVIVARAVDFTGPGSDVADAANWTGSVLPSATTAVKFPAVAIPEGGLTMSGDVKFGATTFPAGYASPLWFDLGMHLYWATNAAIAFQSDVVLTNGQVKCNTFSIASSKSLTLAGPGMKLNPAAACSPIDSKSVFHITDGATFTPVGNSFGVDGKTNAKFTIDRGGTFTTASMSGEYNIATYIKNSTGYEWVFDGGTGRLYTVNWGAKSTGNLGLVKQSLFAARNNSRITFGKNNNMNSRGFRFGFGETVADSASKMSISNRFEVLDSYFSLSDSDGSMLFAGKYDQILVTNSTFNSCGLTVYGSYSDYRFIDNVSVAGAISFNGSSATNILVASGCSSFPKVTVSGVGNQLVLTNTTPSDVVTIGGRQSKASIVNAKTAKGFTITAASVDARLAIEGPDSHGPLTINGTNAVVSVCGGSAGAVSVGGTNNVVEVTDSSPSSISLSGADAFVHYVSTDGTRGLFPSFSGTKTNKVFVFDGGFYQANSYAFSGTNVTIVLKNGGTFQYGNGSSVIRNSFNFSRGKACNFTLAIQDGGLVDIRGMADFHGNEDYRYSWTNCPNSAIEFSGKHPRLVCQIYGSNYEMLGLGTAAETPLTDAVRLRYIIPEGGYEEAPFRYLKDHGNGNRGLWLYGNQPFEIALEKGYEPQRRIKVPLVYTVRKMDRTALNAARLQKFTDNAIVHLDPKKYRWKFYATTDGKTLGVEIIPITGMLLLVR